MRESTSAFGEFGTADHNMAWCAACKVCCGVGCVGKVCPRTDPAGMFRLKRRGNAYFGRNNEFAATLTLYAISAL